MKNNTMFLNSVDLTLDPYTFRIKVKIKHLTFKLHKKRKQNLEIFLLHEKNNTLSKKQNK
jgi:hypothetical protein